MQLAADCIIDLTGCILINKHTSGEKKSVTQAAVISQMWVWLISAAVLQ